MRSFTDFLVRKTGEFQGTEHPIDSSDLCAKFIKYYQSQERIKVNYCDKIITGTVGVTTGWKPAFLLMRRSNCIGSSYVLSKEDSIIAVKRGNKYVEVT